MTATEAKWSERVRAWQASGKTAADFASGQDFQASTLRYWSSKLRTQRPPTLVRVVRGQPSDHVISAAGAELDVVVGSARIVVRRGFDPKLLREVAAALGGSR
jgi:hypothetical protein